MKDVMGLLVRPLSVGRELATRKVIKQFARKFNLVYLGAVNQREDEHELIRGVTVAATHNDDNFCVGEYRGHDISLVERQNTLQHPERPPEQYRWLIMQVDLHAAALPMVFLDANHHDVTFYESLFMRFANLNEANILFNQRDPLFARSFHAFAPADQFEEVDALLTPEITSMLAHYFRQFDYEIAGDHLLIYASNSVITPHVLHEMLRVGSWLAKELDGHDKLVETHKNR